MEDSADADPRVARKQAVTPQQKSKATQQGTNSKNSKSKTPSKGAQQGHGKKQQQNPKGDKQPNSNQNRENAGQFSVKLATLQSRSGKLLHLAQLFVESHASASTDIRLSEESLVYIATNPDRIVENFKMQALFSKEEVAAILSEVLDEDERTMLVKATVDDLKWEDNRSILLWILVRGPDWTVITLQDLQKSVQRVKDKLGISARKLPPPPPLLQQQEQEQEQGSNEKDSDMQQSNNSSYQTPNRSRKKVGGGGRTPMVNSSTTFAWSSFQNSPDPKELPVPRFLCDSSDSKQIIVSADTVALANTCSGGRDGNKFGIPAPPSLPALVKSTALSVIAAEKSTKKAKDKKNKTTTHNPPLQQPENKKKGTPQTRENTNSTHAIAPLSVHGYSRNNTMPPIPQQQQQPTADSIHIDATNELRRMMGIQPSNMNTS